MNRPCLPFSKSSAQYVAALEISLWWPKAFNVTLIRHVPPELAVLQGRTVTTSG